MAMASVDVWCDSASDYADRGLTLLNRSSTGAGVLLTSRVLRVRVECVYSVAFDDAGKGDALFGFAHPRAGYRGCGLLLAAVYLKPKFAAPDWSVFRKIWRFSIPFGLSEGLATIYMQADVTMLAFLAGKATVGIYAPLRAWSMLFLSFHHRFIGWRFPGFQKSGTNIPRCCERDSGSSCSCLAGSGSSSRRRYLPRASGW